MNQIPADKYPLIVVSILLFLSILAQVLDKYNKISAGPYFGIGKFIMYTSPLVFLGIFYFSKNIPEALLAIALELLAIWLYVRVILRARN